jgi:HD superfamily phosphohydrolase
VALEARLAALLHDVGHGPFSHSSEVFYSRFREFDDIRQEKPDLFAEASASEILTYLMITSKPFRKLWEDVCNLYKGQHKDLLSVSLDRLASMIVGSDYLVGEQGRCYRQIINGPFDADKLDYLARDGYFTGLQIAVDVERLLHTVTVIAQGSSRELGVVLSGASILEQVLFGKTQLFVTLYHHHKVRAAHRTLLRLLETMKSDNYRPGGHDLADCVSYLLLDDYDLLCEPSSGSSGDVKDCIRAIKERDLPRRALVLSPHCFKDDKSKTTFGNFDGNDISAIEQGVEASFKNKSGPGWVMVDVPESPRLQQVGQALVDLGGGNVVPMSDVFPAAAWSSAYQAFRRLAYVFAWNYDPQKVAEEVAQAFRDRGVNLADNAWRLAKLNPPSSG